MNLKLFNLLIVFSIVPYLFAQDVFKDRMLVALRPDAPSLPTGLVKAMPKVANSQLFSLMEKYHVTRVERWLRSADASDVFEGINFSKVYRFYFAKTSVVQSAIKEFKTATAVQQVEFEPRLRIAVPIDPVITSDPLLDRQYYLDRIMAPYVWALMDQVPTPEQTILIGDVDTGIDYLHPEMEPVLFINPGEDLNGDGRFTDEDLNGLDDDGNGFVDDVRGWDFSYASDSLPGDNDIRPPSSGGYNILSHGTHVAGIMGAMADNGLGISGIARNYKIIGTKHSLDEDVSNGYLYNAYDGILYCAKLGADVVNCSWGGTWYSELAQKLIDMVRQDYGTIVVAAAGNDNTNNDHTHFYPSDLNGVVTVAALGPDDRKASFSNFGQVIDISAPGVGILSTIHYYKGGYATWAGTSMASPVVAGSIALVKYFFPYLSPDELVNKVLQAADSIDAINNAYAGLLGSGRVNVYNAIAPDFLPAISVLQDSLQFEDLNDNQQIDPGETIRIRLKIANKAGWQDAQNVKVVVSANDSLLHFKDSLAVIGDLPAGKALWTATNDFVVFPDRKHEYGPIQFSFLIEGQTNSGQLLREHYQKQILLSMFQKNFPQYFSVRNSPVSIVTCADSTKKLVFISMDHQLFVVNAQGQVVEPFPIDLQEFHRVPQVLVDLDGDNRQEIVTLSNYGKLKAFKLDGSLIFEHDLQEVVYGSFAVDDLDGDRQPEFIIVTMRKKLHVLTLDGSEKDGFPVNLKTVVPQGVAVADLNGDGKKEIVLGTFDGKLHSFDYTGQERAGWPIELAASIKFSPVIGKDRNGTFIGIITKKNQLQIINADGDIQLNVALRHNVVYNPLLMDCDGDGLLEFCLIDEQNQFIGYNSKNKRFLVKLNAAVKATPLVFKTDGKNRLLTLNPDGRVTIFDENFKPLSYTPVQIPGQLKNYPSLTDLDGDGDMEAILIGNDQLVVLDLPDKVDNQPSWNTYLANEQRTAFFEIDTMQTTTIQQNKPVPQKFRLALFPNPFNASVKIKLSGKNFSANERITVKIFDIRGRLIRTLMRNAPGKNPLVLFWNGQNASGKTVSSGIYFLNFESSKNWQVSKRLVFIK